MPARARSIVASAPSLAVLATVLALAALPAAGCGADAVDPSNPDPRCHPLAVGDCALPWPSSYYLADDTTTATGRRVRIPEGVLPLDPRNVSMNPARLNLLDGFSAAGPLVANLKVRVRAEDLPPYKDGDLSASLAPTARAQVLRFDTGARVPLFAEVDRNAMTGEDQVVIIRPMVRLEPSTRYVVLLRDLVTTEGKPVTNAPFEALKRGEGPQHPRLAPLAARYDEIFALAEKQGVPRASLTLAWDFATGSDSQIHANLISMRDTALESWDRLKPGYEITAVKEAPNESLLRSIEGYFEVPSFLTDDSPYGILKLDERGRPVLRGPQKFFFLVNIPRCAEKATAPLPIMVYGHGLFGSVNELRGYQSRLTNQLCMIQIGTNWIGLSEADVAPVAARVLADFTNFPIITDRLQQAQINFVILTRLVSRRLKDDMAMTVSGKPVTDGQQIYYFGCSQGGIEGGTFMAITPDVERGVLNVGAGNYSLMLSRSHDFRDFKAILDGTYPIQRDQSLLLALSQSYWDFADPIAIAPYLLRAPLPAPSGGKLPPKRIILQEGLADAQVPNLATRMLARAYGLPLLGPAVEPVHGLEVVPGPVDSAYTQWDVKATPVPGPYNIPAPSDNEAHEAVRRLPAAIEQMRRFFKPDGKVEQTCEGPCVFPPK